MGARFEVEVRLVDKLVQALWSLITDQRDLGSAYRKIELIERCLGALPRHSRTQPPHQASPICFSILDICPVGLHHALHGDGHIDVRQAPPDDTVKTRRNDARNGERGAVDQQSPALDRCFGKVRLPVIEIEHRYGIRPFGTLVARNQQAAKRGPHAQRLEIVAAHHLGRYGLGMIVPNHSHTDWSRCDQSAECGVLVAQIAVHGVGEFITMAGSISPFGLGVAGSTAGKAKHYQLARILHR